MTESRDDRHADGVDRDESVCEYCGDTDQWLMRGPDIIGGGPICRRCYHNAADVPSAAGTEHGAK